MDAQGCPQSALGVVLGGSWGSPGTLLSAPGLLWDTFWGAWVCIRVLFWFICVLPGSVRRENSDKLDFDDPLNENAMFSSFRGFQNEPKMVQITPQAPHKVPQRSPGALRSAPGEPLEPPKTTPGAVLGDPWASKKSPGVVLGASGLHL